MEVKIIPAGIYDANCYILFDENTKESAVIDPGGDTDLILDELNNLDAEVKMILLTHGHADHTGAVSELKEKFNCNVYINEKDAEMINEGIPIFGKKNENGDKYINDGDVLEFGNIKIKCLETPGHTPGGMSFLTDEAVFTGDTLFYRSVGRTDFEGGDYDTLIRSINTKLMTLPEELCVFTGHGPRTSIGFEKKCNPFLK